MRKFPPCPRCGDTTHLPSWHTYRDILLAHLAQAQTDLQRAQWTLRRHDARHTPHPTP